MEKYIFGKVLKPQGIKGEIKIEYFLEDSTFLKSLKSFFIDEKKYTIENFRFDVKNIKYAYLKLTEVDSCNLAELLRHKQLYIEKSDVPNLQEDEYFIEDIVGCKVNTLGGEFLGQVVEVEQYGASDIYTIIGPKGKLSFPFIKKIVVSIDVKKKIIIVDSKKFYEVVV